MFAFINVAGYTGTQRGMNKRQKRIFVKSIVELNPTEFHHGDCTGGDEQAHALVREHLPDCKIVIHPPINEFKRAFCEGDVILPAKEYLDRNHDIVNASSKMYATPGENEEQLRSGTWATYRYAKKAGKEVKLILPRREQ